MDITFSSSVSTAASYAGSDTAGSASLLVLKKAMDTQAAGALALINTLPQSPALATEGQVGRNINTYA